MNVEFREVTSMVRGEVVSVFDTARDGHLQVGFNGDEIVEFPSEPDLNFYTEEEQWYIKATCVAVWKLTLENSNT